MYCDLGLNDMGINSGRGGRLGITHAVEWLSGPGLNGWIEPGPVHGGGGTLSGLYGGALSLWIHDKWQPNFLTKLPPPFPSGTPAPDVTPSSAGKDHHSL